VPPNKPLNGYPLCPMTDDMGIMQQLGMELKLKEEK
jgi:hypothetical protein